MASIEIPENLPRGRCQRQYIYLVCFTLLHGREEESNGRKARWGKCNCLYESKQEKNSTVTNCF